VAVPAPGARIWGGAQPAGEPGVGGQDPHRLGAVPDRRAQGAWPVARHGAASRQRVNALPSTLPMVGGGRVTVPYATPALDLLCLSQLLQYF